MSQAPDRRLVKSYVWHGEQCFFVSTIERTSSAMCGPGRFNETLAWEFDWDTNTRGKLVGTTDALAGLRQHFLMCQKLHETGSP